MRILKKIRLIFLVIALASAGAFFMGCTTDKVPAFVRVNGIEVGGMSYERAAARIRAETEKTIATKKLVIRGGRRDYVFSYPEIGYKDDVARVLRSARRGGVYSASTRYYLKGAYDAFRAIAEAESTPVREPSFIFRAEGEPFVYDFGCDGEKVDLTALARDAEKSLAEGGEVTLKMRSSPRRISGEEILRKTAVLGSFTTYYDGSNANRSSNIRLAANLINGVKVGADEVFSFNAAVGKRTAERGFSTAKIIEDGEFVEGVGGGVCQVSTTLYNAALLSGCKIREYHPHSLPVSYVPPSRDAMVSGEYCDLKFSRPAEFYIRAQTGENSVTFTFYGESDGFKYSLESEVKGYIEPPVEKGETPREGRRGIISECYLAAERNGYTVRRLIRRDEYAPQKRITATDCA